MASTRVELATLKRLLAEADLVLSTATLPENRTARFRELLATAITLAESLLTQTKMPAAAQLGAKGGSQTAKRGSEYFRQLAARRKTRAGGRPKKEAE